MKALATILLALISGASVVAQTHWQKYGLVPDASTAAKIAEAVLIPVYGRKLVESERPFRARLADDVWTVGGTLYCGVGKPQSTNFPTCVGGAAVVKISKKNGCILFMTHYK